jgi:hypothetical protein
VRSLSAAWWAIFDAFVIADNGRKRRYQHQRTLNEFVDLLQIGLSALDQELAEVGAAIGHDRDGMGGVENHQRLVNVHLDITASGAEAHKAALFLIRYEMGIRAFLEDHVSPLPWLVVD